MPSRPIDPVDKLLASGLPLDRPFDYPAAEAAGVGGRWLRRLVLAGHLNRPLRGVYLPAGVTETLEVRVACVRLVLPPRCVITDRTAAWLHGAPMALAPNDHLVVPPVSAFHLPHHRLANSRTASGARGLLRTDVVDLGGLPVTTPLRTACDLGRLLHRDSALAALDALLALGRFSRDRLLAETSRFRGYRGVRQLRSLAPLADAGSESFGESALRLRWHDALPSVTPETQIQVMRPGSGEVARLDVGSTEHRYAAEYDGALFHGPGQAEHDVRRRRWIEDELGWVVGVYRKEDVFGPRAAAFDRLKDELGRAKLHVRRASAY